MRLHVTNALNAEQLDLTVVYNKYEPIKTSIGESLLNFATGEHVKGIETIEEMLLTDTSLIAIGEIIINNDGRFIY